MPVAVVKAAFALKKGELSDVAGDPAKESKGFIEVGLFLESMTCKYDIPIIYLYIYCIEMICQEFRLTYLLLTSRVFFNPSCRLMA